GTANGKDCRLGVRPAREMGRQRVMRVTRLGATVTALVAMSGALAVARADGLAGDPVRQRAEDLAQAASEQFDDFLRPQRVAQAQTGKPSSKDAASDAWSSPSTWVERSGREYQQLMQRLTQVQEPAKPAHKPAATPAEKGAAPVEKKAQPGAAVADKAG